MTEWIEAKEITLMRKILMNLQPKLVWDIFEDISKVPRPSKKEENIRNWVKDWAKRNRLEVAEDTTGNILISKRAIKGLENCQGIILQGHMDMVCQKSQDSNHNFDVDPISLKIVDNYVTADGTTLGADNGIGMAMALVVLVDHNVKHGPIDVLLTVDEETGLTGAFALKKDFIRYPYLINLDSEDEGEITAGSAGGGDTKIVLKVVNHLVQQLGIEISISGLKGGHSGIDIHLPRLNAIKLMAELIELVAKTIPIELVAINGGSAHNAIPRDCTAVITIQRDDRGTFDELLNNWMNDNPEFTEKEPQLKVKINETTTKSYIEKGLEIIQMLKEIPHGPLKYSESIEGLVETSNNLALVETKDNEIIIYCSTRSSKDLELEKVRKSLRELAESKGAEVEQGTAYPGWNPDLNSPLLKLVKREYERHYGKEVKLRAIHAGLECGLFKGLNPKLQIVSFGPEIKDGHSPDERVYIESVKLTWNVLKSVLEKVDELK